MFWAVFMCFSPYLGIGCGGEGVLPRDWYTSFFRLYSSKVEVFETYFFIFCYFLSTQYDHPRYVKHVLGRIYVFFTLFGYWVREGGVPKGLVHNLLMRFFSPIQLKKRSFRNLFF